MKILDGGVTSPKGFLAAGLRAGIKPGKTNKDMAMILSEEPAAVAGTFTRNVVKAAPVLWGQKLVKDQETVRAVVINTGIANACTGEKGYDNTVRTAEMAASELGVLKEEVLVSSTGVIGQPGCGGGDPHHRYEDKRGSSFRGTLRHGGDRWGHLQGLRHDPSQHGNHARFYHHRHRHRKDIAVRTPERTD